ncbi:MAG TPA: hypothetical protein VFK13_00175 [Gemmatimonadaceae bacterium]|nr:hypothetical protein [Gemmatimonadaceae bacterium]
MTPWSTAATWAIQTAVPTAQIAGGTASASTFEIIAGTAMIVLALALIALLVLLLLAAQRLRSALGDAQAMLSRLEARVDPVIRHATTAAEHAGYITAAVRADVDRVSETVEDATDRVRRGLDAVEHRAAELDAFLQVVQEEAEDTFVAAAASVRGMRRGASALRHAARRAADRLADRADGHDHALDEEFDEMDDELDEELDAELEDEAFDDDDDAEGYRDIAEETIPDEAARAARELDDDDAIDAAGHAARPDDEEDEDGTLDTNGGRRRGTRPRIRRRGSV